ncbi:SDR family oxidoreductase [Alphaproteobacteria bacterium]|nr:SDR family oxidoreductase [Alphaproteobacteria bacterium]
MELGLGGKKVLVTGGSKGIGLAITKGFIKEGAKVWVLARSQKLLKTTEQDLGANFGHEKIMSTSCDCTDLAELNIARLKIEKQWGGLDIIIANIGDGRSTTAALPSNESWEKTWRTNFETTLNTSRTFLPSLIDGKGSILFISSIAGFEAFGAPTDYSTAKSALQALAKNLARKLAPQIRVNVVAPGNVFFPGSSWEQKRKENKKLVDDIIKKQVPMQRFATPIEIANAALFLSSDCANFITGTTLVVDGGQTVGIWH